jgi:hypothetical protein
MSAAFAFACASIALAATTAAPTTSLAADLPPIASYSFEQVTTASFTVPNSADSHSPPLEHSGRPQLNVVSGRLHNLHSVRLDPDSYYGTGPDFTAAGFSSIIIFRKNGPGTFTGNNGAKNATIVAIGDGYKVRSYVRSLMLTTALNSRLIYIDTCY